MVGLSRIGDASGARKDASRLHGTQDNCADELFFFFQAEDGIRDVAVTGVQTCALPIYVLRERKLDARVGIELSQFSQICDRMVGEPTVYWQGYYDAFRSRCREVIDAAPLLAEVRMIKTAQEIERMRFANELASIGMEYARRNIRPGMKESEVAAMIEGHIHKIDRKSVV